MMPMVLCMTVLCNPHNQRLRVRRDFAGLVTCCSHFTDENKTKQNKRSFGHWIAQRDTANEWLSFLWRQSDLLTHFSQLIRIHYFTLNVYASLLLWHEDQNAFFFLICLNTDITMDLWSVLLAPTQLPQGIEKAFLSPVGWPCPTRRKDLG